MPEGEGKWGKSNKEKGSVVKVSVERKGRRKEGMKEERKGLRLGRK